MRQIAYPSMTTWRARVGISWEQAVGIATGMAVAYLVGTPLLMLVFSSFRSTRDRLPFEATGFTPDNYLLILQSQSTYQLLGNTVMFAVGAVGLALALSMGFSYVIERTNIPWRSLAMVFVLAPMAMPPFVAAYAWILLANPTNGAVNELLKRALGHSGEGPLNVYSVVGMILVTATILVPSMYVMLSGTFARMDPALEEASRLSGVGPWATIRRVTVPLLRPGILGAAIYYFIAGVEIFEIPALLGIPGDTYVLSTWIYFLVRRPAALPDYGLASAYAVLVMVAAAFLIHYYGRTIRRQERFVTVTGRGYRTQLADLGQWRYFVFAALALYALLSVVLPLAILLWKSLAPDYADLGLDSLSRLSLARYAAAISSGKVLEATKNTAIIAAVTATATMTLAACIAWLGVRSGLRGGVVPDRLTFIAQGTPSIIVALAVMFLYVAIPLPIYGTLWIIVIALGTRFLPYGARVMHAAYYQLHRELEEASRTSGVGWWWTMLRVILPLAWPSFLRGWLWMFVHAIRDATIPLLLITVENVTISTVVWQIWWEGDQAAAATLSVILMLVSAVLTYFVARQSLLAKEKKEDKEEQMKVHR